MKSLIEQVKKTSLKAKFASDPISYLNHTWTDPNCMKIVEKMTAVTMKDIGLEGENDPYHFQKDLNRVTISGSDDYRLVLFFIKKGARMHLHDHPNMCVFFRMMFGKLNYKSYDKIEDKYRYNDFSLDQYHEFLETKKTIGAKLANKTVLSGDQFLMVRPSSNNMHEFQAEENTCFFDICLPNYTADSLRRITYFDKVLDSSTLKEDELRSVHEHISSPIDGLTYFKYDTTPPKLPFNFSVNDIEYRGNMDDEKLI